MYVRMKYLQEKQKGLNENYMKKESSTRDDMPTLSEKDFERAIPLQNFLEAKKSITIRLKASTLYYFQQMSNDTGVPYQTLINMYLDDCAQKKLKLNISWDNK